jgi:hypothetical protein
MILLIITIIILSCVIDNTRKQNVILKQERNYLSQTLDKMKSEEVRKQEIIEEQNSLLLEVKKCNTPNEYYKVWSRINEWCKE